jgi:hypothetical protein
VNSFPTFRRLAAKLAACLLVVTPLLVASPLAARAQTTPTPTEGTFSGVIVDAWPDTGDCRFHCTKGDGGSVCVTYREFVGCDFEIPGVPPGAIVSFTSATVYGRPNQASITTVQLYVRFNDRFIGDTQVLQVPPSDCGECISPSGVNVFDGPDFF